MALQFMLLDIFGILAALFIAGLIYLLGGANAFGYLVVMLVFLASGTFVTIIGREKKESMGLYEYGRSWQNVLANGLVPIAAIALGSPGAYLGAVASITADKFSSEIGCLGSEPVFIGDGKRCARGTSGAVSPLGTVAALVGAEIIAIAAYLLLHGVNLGEAMALPFIGLAGSMADSLAGVWETRGMGNKATSNIAGALAGALLGVLAFYLL